MYDGTVQLATGMINYRIRGTGPPLVLLTTLSGSWMRQVPKLQHRFTCITYDMRGFGESQTSQPGFPSNECHADDLAAVLDALGIDRAVVVGLSHGGLVGQHFAVRHPERIAGLALVATFAKATNSTALFLEMLYGFLERDDIANFWEVLKSFLFSEASKEVLRRREAAFRRAMFDQYTTASLRSIYGQAINHDSTAWLDAIRCPTLVVGGAEDMLFPPTITQRLADGIPNSKVELLPAAHLPPVEAPKDFNMLITDVFGGDQS
jgi:3-oxoadipate enol-lactonase